jgi:hypothetical protein
LILRTPLPYCGTTIANASYRYVTVDCLLIVLCCFLNIGPTYVVGDAFRRAKVHLLSFYQRARMTKIPHVFYRPFISQSQAVARVITHNKRGTKGRRTYDLSFGFR